MGVESSVDISGYCIEKIDFLDFTKSESFWLRVSSKNGIKDYFECYEDRDFRDKRYFKIFDYFGKLGKLGKLPLNLIFD